MSDIISGHKTYGSNQIEVFQWNEGAKCYIGKYCSIAEKVKVFLGGNHTVDWVTTFPFDKTSRTKGDIHIGNDVWVSHGVTIMSGVTIGDGAVIAANSHVVKNVEPYAIVGGNPANFIRYRFEKEIIDLLMEFKWWNLPDNIVSDIKRDLLKPPDADKIRLWIKKYGKNHV
jgi:acetyltransferase-like isoleucine patch superfamily enzyme